MRLIFYLQYIGRKIIVNLFEIKYPVGKIFLLNVVYIFSKIFTKINWIKYANFNYVVSIFGKFNIRPKTFDAICASPDFERPDINFTIGIIRKMLNRGRTIAYLDIGADFGLYSILLGNKFKNDDKLQIYGFEPFEESYELFLKNVNANNLDNKVVTLNLGLYNSDGIMTLNLNQSNPGSNSINFVSNPLNEEKKISITKLDNCLDLIENVSRDILFMKLDIEGSEKRAIEGGKKFINSFNEVYIMVEDFVDESIIDYLKSQSFKLIAKRTPYNSFWYKKNET